MTNLVGGSAAQVVGSGGAAGYGLTEDGAAVEDEVGRAGRVAGCREVAVSEKTAAKVAEEVDVEVRVGTLSESALHGLLVAVGSPVGVDGPVTADKAEADAVGAVGAVHDSELVVQLGLLWNVLVFLIVGLRSREQSSYSKVTTAG